jgi:hypothetical protein
LKKRLVRGILKEKYGGFKVEEKKQEEIISVLEQAQQQMAVIKQTMINNINEKIMPFKAQKTLRENKIDIGAMVKESVMAWASMREKIMPNGYEKPSDMINWNTALVEILEAKINHMMDNEPDKVFALCEILTGKKLDENSAEDGILIGDTMNNFAGYLAEACKKRFIELQEVAMGKSLLKLQETASVLNTLTSMKDGSKSQQ